MGKVEGRRKKLITFLLDITLTFVGRKNDQVILGEEITLKTSFNSGNRSIKTNSPS